jgi:signal transduction histidine kinase/ActR/RegA family two-component response regulator
LQRIGAVFVREGDLPAVLGEVVDAAIAISGAAKGDIQLYNRTLGTLNMAAQRGFDGALLDFWSNVSGGSGACGTAMEREQRVIVEDVATSPIFVGTPALDVLLQAGVRAVQSTPVMSRSGKLLAVLSTHFAASHRPDERALRLLDLLARQTADIIERARAEADLRSAYEQAEAATHAKDEFLAVVSHELRSPLTAVLGYARLLRAETAEPGQVKQMAEIIERNGRMQLQLIEDLLDIARIISGKLKLEVQPVDLVTVITAALDVVRPALQAKGIELHASLDPLAGQVTGDPDRLQQVVWNLLSNAIKFTPQGGRAEIVLRREDPHVQIIVRDTGKGIEREFLPHIFERFRQSDMSSTRRVGGLGLGLSLVKHLVELHGGTVDADSPGAAQGSVFTIRLPLRAIYTAPPTERKSMAALLNSGAQSLRELRALIVDDEEDVRLLLAMTLESYGARVHAVPSGRQALDVLDRQAGQGFDVLICDIGMPDEDGYSVIRKVRKLTADRGSQVPAIALTAYGRAEDRVRALGAGFQMHIAKPVEPDELVAVILSLVKRFGATSRSAGI